MKLVKIAGAVLNQIPLAWDRNKQNILDAIAEAKREQVSILCLPELCISGYGCDDMFLSPGVQDTAQELLLEILPHTKGMIVSLGLPIPYQNRVFNTCCLVVDGKILGFVAKQHLPGDGIHYEPRWFTRWQDGTRGQVLIGGEWYPIGDMIFKVGGIKIGFEICEDAWVSSRPGTRLHKYGIDLILNPSASHFAFDKLDVRKRFVLEGSRAFGCSYVYANHTGNEAGRAIYDGGTLIASVGQLQAVGERLIFDDFRITAAVVDIELNRLSQSQSSVPFTFADLTGICFEAAFDYPKILPEVFENQDKLWEHSRFKQEEEFARALPLACTITCAKAIRRASWCRSAEGQIRRRLYRWFI